MMMMIMIIMLILPKATLAWLEASGKGQLPRCLQLGTYTEIQQQYMYIFSKYKLYIAVQCHCKKSIHPIQYQVASMIQYTAINDEVNTTLDTDHEGPGSKPPTSLLLCFASF